MTTQTEAMKRALDAQTLALEYWQHRQQRYKNRAPVWVEKTRASITALREALAEQPAPVQEPSVPASDNFLQGVCVALQAVTGSGDGVLWREVVEAAGADDLLQYAAHIEPEEWELAGFGAFAKAEMNRGKPKKLAAQPAQQEPIAIHQVLIDGGWQDREEYELWQYSAELWRIRTVYTTPQAQPAREWVGLTDEELEKLCEDFWLYPRKLLKAIESKLKEKNRG